MKIGVQIIIFSILTSIAFLPFSYGNQNIEIEKDAYGRSHYKIDNETWDKIRESYWEASDYKDQKKFEKAIELYHKILEIQIESMGNEDVYLIDNIEKLANLYSLNGDFLTAEKFMKTYENFKIQRSKQQKNFKIQN